MALVSLSPLVSMSVKYLWSKTATTSYYFKRRVPKDVREQVGKDWVQVCLNTRDLKAATKQVIALAQKTDTDWEFLRNPTRSAKLAQAHAMLKELGITPGVKGEESEGLYYFRESIEKQLPEEAKEQDWLHSIGQAHEGADWSAFVPEVPLMALEIAYGTMTLLASDCLDFYLQVTPCTPQATKTNTIAFNKLIAHLGNRDVRKYRREDANSFVKYLLEVTGVKTTTVDRYITTLRSAWNVLIQEKELDDAKNPWEKLKIPKLGEDSKKRIPFTVPDYLKLYSTLGTPKDDLGCLLVILAETGARLAEIVGLSVADCFVTEKQEVPYIFIRTTDWRRLKTGESTRQVPLTPKALDAVKIALRLAKRSPCLFPRYLKNKTTNATTASSTLNAKVRSMGIDLTVHSLRHGMTDLLRAVRCQDPIRKQIQGWAKSDIAGSYGEGYSLQERLKELVSATAVLQSDAAR